VKEKPAQDNMLEKMVTAELRGLLREPEAGCPDAETVAAYLERGLTPDERAACETHLVTCSRCQLQVAELARLSESDEVAGVQIGEPTHPVPHAPRARPFRLAWATSLLLALIVAALWYRPEFRRLLRPQQETVVKSPAPAEGPEKPSETAGAQPARPAEAPPAAR